MGDSIEIYKVQYAWKSGNMSTSDVLYFESREAMEKKVFELEVNRQANHHDVQAYTWRFWRDWRNIFAAPDDDDDMTVQWIKVWKLTPRITTVKNDSKLGQEKAWTFDWLELKIKTTHPSVEVGVVL